MISLKIFAPLYTWDDLKNKFAKNFVSIEVIQIRSYLHSPDKLAHIFAPEIVANLWRLKTRIKAAEFSVKHPASN